MTAIAVDPQYPDTLDELNFDFEFSVDTEIVDKDATPDIQSIILCTPGCTSPGGGSFCSWCCIFK